MEHKLDWTETGSGNMGSITPTCACGWTGAPEYNYNDDQMTSAQRQWKHHMREVGQLRVGQPAPIYAGGHEVHQSTD